MPAVTSDRAAGRTRLRVIRFAAGVAFASLLPLASLLLSSAVAVDLPCPPKHTACWQVRLAVNKFGEDATVALSRRATLTHGREGRR
jgi:hypothetical protein